MYWFFCVWKGTSPKKHEIGDGIGSDNDCGGAGRRKLTGRRGRQRDGEGSSGQRRSAGCVRRHQWQPRHWQRQVRADTNRQGKRAGAMAAAGEGTLTGKGREPERRRTPRRIEIDSFYSILFYSIFYILFYSILFYSILFYSNLFYLECILSRMHSIPETRKDTRKDFQVLIPTWEVIPISLHHFFIYYGGLLTNSLNITTVMHTLRCEV